MIKIQSFPNLIKFSIWKNISISSSTEYYVEPLIPIFLTKLIILENKTCFLWKGILFLIWLNFHFILNKLSNISKKIVELLVWLRCLINSEFYVGDLPHKVWMRLGQKGLTWICFVNIALKSTPTQTQWWDRLTDTLYKYNS